MPKNTELNHGEEVAIVALSAKEQLANELHRLFSELPYAVLHIGGVNAEMISGSFSEELESNNPQEVIADKFDRAERFFQELAALNVKPEVLSLAGESSLSAWLKEVTKTLTEKGALLKDLLLVASEEPELAMAAIQELHDQIVTILKRTVMYTADVIFSAADENGDLKTLHRPGRDSLKPLAEKDFLTKYNELKEMYRPGQLIQWQVALGVSKLNREDKKNVSFKRKIAPTFIVEARLPTDRSFLLLMSALVDNYNPNANTRVSMVEFLEEQTIPFTLKIDEQVFDNIDPSLVRSLVIDKTPPTKEVLQYLVNEEATFDYGQFALATATVINDQSVASV